MPLRVVLAWLGSFGLLIALGTAEGLAENALASRASNTIHWAFQPIAITRPPSDVSLPDGPVTHPIDRFIRTALARERLLPAARADRRVLIRRASWDLLGLPPSPQEVDAFLTDPSPDAFERLVERLLASPHYGERWGRWWLDLARYADTNGQDENKVMANAWRYRDWVIRAFNADLPFDQFATEQLAGDLLPTNGVPEQVLLDRLIATGFLVLGPKMLAEQDKPKLVLDIVDEQIDVVTRAFLGLTVACARCHDHKFDPIPARDYYALAGIFKSTRTMENLAFVSKFNERRISTQEKLVALSLSEQAIHAKSNELATAVLALTTQADLEYADIARRRTNALQHELDQLKRAAPLPAEFALAVVEENPPVDLPVHVRGSHLNPTRDPVPRGFIHALHPGAWPALPADHSGRLEFARWLTSRDNPLTSRVIANRIWQAHFGEGLVRTPDNFGIRGEAPSHPDLLDWLAREFQRMGWSMKAMHRLILSSSTWQQTTAADAFDIDNRWLAHFPRQRLEAEMIRDALLCVSGRLDSQMGGSLVQWKNDEYVPRTEDAARSVRRSVYLPVVRDLVYDVFSIFDFPNPSVGVAKRTPTVVSHQALFFMNSPLVKASAIALAEELHRSPAPGDGALVRLAYRYTLNRQPSDEEIARAVRFLQQPSGNNHGAYPFSPLAALCQTLFAANEFIYRD